MNINERGQPLMFKLRPISIIYKNVFRERENDNYTIFLYLELIRII